MLLLFIYNLKVEQKASQVSYANEDTGRFEQQGSDFQGARTTSGILNFLSRETDLHRIMENMDRQGTFSLTPILDSEEFATLHSYPQFCFCCSGFQ